MRHHNHLAVLVFVHSKIHAMQTTRQRGILRHKPRSGFHPAQNIVGVFAAVTVFKAETIDAAGLIKVSG